MGWGSHWEKEIIISYERRPGMGRSPQKKGCVGGCGQREKSGSSPKKWGMEKFSGQGCTGGGGGGDPLGMGVGVRTFRGLHRGIGGEDVTTQGGGKPQSRVGGVKKGQISSWATARQKHEKHRLGTCSQTSRHSRRSTFSGKRK